MHGCNGPEHHAHMQGKNSHTIATYRQCHICWEAKALTRSYSRQTACICCGCMVDLRQMGQVMLSCVCRFARQACKSNSSSSGGGAEPYVKATQRDEDHGGDMLATCREALKVQQCNMEQATGVV